MTEEEYLRMKNILNAMIEQQDVSDENLRKADARITEFDRRMSLNAEAIASLLTLVQMHEQEITKTNERMNARFEQVAATIEEIGKKSAETDERINALVNVVERYIGKGVAKKVKPRANRNITARLSPRLVRVVFERRGKQVWTSLTYNSRNIMPKIVKYARGQARKAGVNIDGAKEIPQVKTGNGWKVATYSAPSLLTLGEGSTL